MSTERGALPNPEVWRPMQLQLIVFPITPAVLAEQNWWRSVTGQEPAESNRKAFERTDSGVLPDCSLSVSIDPVKVSWAMTPRLDLPDLAATAPPTLSEFPQSAERLAALIASWLSDQCPPIKRVGLAGSLIQDAQSHADAYQLLDRYLPTVNVDPQSYDFQFRVNRKRNSNIIDGLSVNRLTVWSALRVASFFQTINLGEEAQRAPTFIGPPRFAAMLGLDINSDSERADELPPAKRLDLFQELIGMANEIAAFGDKP